MRYLLVLLVCCGASLSASPASAFKYIEGCDIVAFAGQSSPVPIPPERWQAYGNSAAFLLTQSTQSAAAANWRDLAFKLVDLQKNLLAPDRGSTAYQDYLASDRCSVLVKLNANAVDSLLDEAAQSASGDAMAALRAVIDAGRAQIDRIERSARFRSNEDKVLMLAGYYCFDAGAIAALLPPERLARLELKDFGETVSCTEAGRTG